ncbi:MAG: peptidoglycan-binding protein [Gammaproteobacteria bacterium]|nr:peptidoglycan-binding protein [Gammaproteobacteria bacterium]
MVIKNIALTFAALSVAGVSMAQNTEQPAIPVAPTSVPGQCHALVNVPAKLESRVEEILSQDAGEALEVTPAKYEWVEKQFPITEEEETVEVIPATYKTIEEKITVEPARKEYEVIPAQYKEVTEQVMVKPAMRVWRKSANGAASLVGEVMRLIEVPAEYETVVKQKLVSDPQVREVIIPAEQAVVKKKVIDTPATTRKVIIPAEMKTIRVKELVAEAKEIRTPTAPVMKKISRFDVVQPAQLKWQRVPCDSDLNEANLIAIQKGLKAAGYNVTPDGKFGKGSREALEKFQESKGLAKGAITLETMKALGVDID